MHVRAALPLFRPKLLVAAIVVVIGVPPVAQAQHSGRVDWDDALDQDDAWYGSEEARRIADNVLLYQDASGGWLKNTDMSRELTASQRARLERGETGGRPTIDNGGTVTQIRYLARVATATGEQRYATACRRGVEYLLDAQYPGGGWPQIYPLDEDYSRHITFNDGAMIGVMRLLDDVAAGEPNYEVLDESFRDRAVPAIAHGIDAILKCQVVVEGTPTVWCAQHDAQTLEPAQARAYELPSLSGSESVGIVRYLMDIDEPTSEVRSAIGHAVAWFEAAKIEGKRVDRIRAPGLDPPRDVVVVDDPNAEPIWARFNAIGTNTPMFVGRDGVVHDSLADIEHERRTGYAYLGDWPRRLLERDYPAWQKKWGER
jgi:PelA/Pel-15E family pectate lyase